MIAIIIADSILIASQASSIYGEKIALLVLLMVYSWRTQAETRLLAARHSSPLLHYGQEIDAEGHESVVAGTD